MSALLLKGRLPSDAGNSLTFRTCEELRTLARRELLLIFSLASTGVSLTKSFCIANTTASGVFGALNRRTSTCEAWPSSKLALFIRTLAKAAVLADWKISGKRLRSNSLRLET